MMTFDHDKFLPRFVKLSTSPYCTNISSQYNGTHYNDNAQHGARYNSTKCTTLPLPGKSQCTHLSSVNVHNDRPIDSAHFARPMSHDSTYTSASLAHVCSDRLADSTRVVSYIRRQYARTVPNVDIVGSSKCHTRHLATGGVARFNYVLVTNSNPVTTCASDGRVNPYPNIQFPKRIRYKIALEMIIQYFVEFLRDSGKFIYTSTTCTHTGSTSRTATRGKNRRCRNSCSPVLC